MAKNLIIYYSRTGENYVNGSIKNLKKGNTEICAEFIKEAVSGILRKSAKVRSLAQVLQSTEQTLQNHRRLLLTGQ